MSVVVPVWVPTTMTVAPMTGSPASSTTVPLTLFCAQAIAGLKTTKSDKSIASIRPNKAPPLLFWDKCFIDIEF